MEHGRMEFRTTGFCGGLLNVGEWIKKFRGQAPELVVEKIMRFLHRVSRPVYLGEIAMDIGFSIAQTEEFINDLVDQGYIRRGTKKEINTLGGCPDAVVIALNGKHNLQMAHKP